jgi:hypothetical protein
MEDTPNSKVFWGFHALVTRKFHTFCWLSIPKKGWFFNLKFWQKKIWGFKKTLFKWVSRSQLATQGKFLNFFWITPMSYFYISKLSHQNVIRLFTGFLEFFFSNNQSYYEKFCIFCQKNSTLKKSKNNFFLCVGWKNTLKGRNSWS